MALWGNERFLQELDEFFAKLASNGFGTPTVDVEPSVGAGDQLFVRFARMDPSMLEDSVVKADTTIYVHYGAS